MVRFLVTSEGGRQGGREGGRERVGGRGWEGGRRERRKEGRKGLSREVIGVNISSRANGCYH